ncbi:MAG TPA: Coenzyme F420 hydrogenase/dehydrogenase, beta subunit C-terminal domain [Candidatus Methanofastidiosa archaeon]|nr:Coenzyme F420 hydrogenase/dehydrogenase, beta subunit C-terminal domain [Candidatus Methanofastidiosa archaeon]HPR41059.1 Coenzyme F420 hydrogenase/dehydrogenase, beta subunit C-terminal domain [Candidatus Methanofastidiosa archaeon]
MENYIQLRDEVWYKGLCSGCSICTVVCPMKTILFVDGHPDTYSYCKSERDEVPCGGCFSCCPRLDTFLHKHGVGDYLRIVAAKARIEVSKKQSGGAVTGILYNGLKRDLIDAVIMVGQDHTTLMTYSVAVTDSEKLLCHAGSKYVWYTPSLTALRDIMEEGKYRRIAVVGTPCVCQALRKMLNSDNSVLNKLKDNIELIIGVFCTEIFDYDNAIKYLAENGIEPGDIKRIDIKKDIIIDKYDGERVELPIGEDLMREGCKFCLDFTAVDADISAGSIGSEEDYTTLIVRTNNGEFFVNSAEENGYLQVEPLESIDNIEKFAKLKYKRNKKNVDSLLGDKA